MGEFNAFRAAQVIGITGSAWLSGNICGLSFIALPALFRQNQDKTDPTSRSQTTLARQWQALYNAGKVQNPPIAAISGCALYYLAYAARSSVHGYVAAGGAGSAYYSDLAGPSTGAWYAAAAFLTLGIVPWTLVLMLRTNDNLAAIAGVPGDAEARGEVATGLDDEEFDGLMGWWQVLNAIRGLFPLAGGVLGLVLALY